jgi:hypothetical protein
VGAERERGTSFESLEDGLRNASPWYLFGPYLSERQWGTVREDYSSNGEAWGSLPHEWARSKAYRARPPSWASRASVRRLTCDELELAEEGMGQRHPTLLFCDNLLAHLRAEVRQPPR